MRLRLAPCVLLLPLSLASSLARANTDVEAYDARTVGMAGAGMIENGASLFQNPASLQATDHFAVTVVASPFVGWGHAPATANGSREGEGPSVAPLFLIGANVRLLDRLVVGAVAYPASGYGAQYDEFKGTPQATTVKVSETGTSAAVGASFAILPRLAVGGSLGLGWASETTQNFPTSGLNGNASGHGLVGQLGVYYRPLDNLRIGLAWQAKSVTDIQGSLTVGSLSIPVTTKAATPNSFKLGVQLGVLDDRLVLAAGVAYWMYSDSDASSSLTGTVSGSPITITSVYDWKDSYAGVLGGEWWLTPVVPIRAGVALTRSATPYSRPSPFFPPPGWLTSLTTGTGVRLEHWQFDLGVAFSFDTAHVDAPAQDPATPLGPAQVRYSGTYAFADVLASISGTYKF